MLFVLLLLLPLPPPPPVLQSSSFMSVNEVAEAVNIPAFILQLHCLDPSLNRPTGVLFASFSVLQIAQPIQHCTVTCMLELFISSLPNS